jgi:hypothetical protein
VRPPSSARVGENSTVDVAFSLYLNEREVPVLMTVSVPDGYFPGGIPGEIGFEPWTLNYRLIALAAVDGTVCYLKGHGLPCYIAIKRGQPELSVCQGKAYFINRHSMEWLGCPLGFREGQQTVWLEREAPNPSALQQSHWLPLTFETWPNLWEAIDSRYRLSAHLQEACIKGE